MTEAPEQPAGQKQAELQHASLPSGPNNPSSGSQTQKNTARWQPSHTNATTSSQTTARHAQHTQTLHVQSTPSLTTQPSSARHKFLLPDNPQQLLATMDIDNGAQTCTSPNAYRRTHQHNNTRGSPARNDATPHTSGPTPICSTFY
jgi:hypothetical protein